MRYLLPIFLLIPWTETHSQPLDTIGANSLISASAGAGRAVEKGPIASFYNPASLTLEKDFCVEVTYTTLFPRYIASITDFGSLGRIEAFQKMSATGFDVEATKHFIINSAKQATEKRFSAGLMFSGTMPFKRIITVLDREVTFGGLIFLPGSGSKLVEVEGQTPTSFVLPWLGTRDEHLIAALSMGVEIIPEKLAVGAGVIILADISGSVISSTPIAVFNPSKPNNPPPPEPAIASFHQSLSTDIAPVIGALFRPASWLLVGASFRGEMALSLDFAVKAGVYFDLGGTPIQAEIPFKLQGQYFYMPSEVTLSLSAKPHERITLLGDLTYAFTSTLEDHLPVTRFTIDQSAIGSSGEILALSNLGFFRTNQTPPIAADTRDIVIPRIGLEWAFQDWAKVRLGYAYHPSPLSPNQLYKNMLLDSGYHKIGFGISGNVTFGKIFRSPTTIAIHGNAMLLNRRYNQVGVEGKGKGIIKTSGHALGTGISITMRF